MSDIDGPERTKMPEAVLVEGGGLFQSREDGQLHFTPESVGSTDPIAAPVNATPLEEDEPEGIIPPSPLWAMKEHRHEQWVMFGHSDRIRQCIGTGDGAVYVIDDGKRHCMIGRRHKRFPIRDCIGEQVTWYLSVSRIPPTSEAPQRYPRPHGSPLRQCQTDRTGSLLANGESGRWIPQG